MVESLYNDRRPWLERLVSGALGQPLQLGPYAGLRPLGLAAGRSRFLPAPNHPSSVDAPAVELALDPLGSLWQRALVLQIRVMRPTVQLRRNARGAFWELPSQKPGREPPRVALRIQVPQPGRGVLHSLAGSIPFTLRGEADLPLWRREVDLRGTLSPQEYEAMAIKMGWTTQEKLDKIVQRTRDGGAASGGGAAAQQGASRRMAFVGFRSEADADAVRDGVERVLVDLLERGFQFDIVHYSFHLSGCVNSRNEWNRSGSAVFFSGGTAPAASVEVLE